MAQPTGRRLDEAICLAAMTAHEIYVTFLRLNAVNLDRAYEAGMLRKSELEDGAAYIGYCRNTEKAVWDARLGKFQYTRCKFGILFKDEVEHPEDDRGFDVFVPIQKEI